MSVSYSGASPLLSPGQATAAEIQSWIEENANRIIAETGLTGYQVPPDLGSLYVAYGQLTRLNHDLMAAQAAKETAFFTSAIFRLKRNPAGIGAVNDNAFAGAITFDTVEQGIRAQFAHMCSYVFGEDHVLIEYSVRHTVLRDIRNDRSGPNGYLGIVEVLSDLTQRWAWTPPKEYAKIPPELRYGNSIATWANRLLDTVWRGDDVADLVLPHHPDLGHHLREDGPFARWWLALAEDLGPDEALLLTGYPITNEFEENGVVCQYTERMRLEHHPGARPGRFDVLLGHLGREDLTRRNEAVLQQELIDDITLMLDRLRP